jgi:hypothetical protein
MDPLAAAILDCLPYAIHANPLVVVAANRKHRCDFAEPANQVTQPAEFGRTVYQVAAKQHHIRIAARDGIQYLRAEPVGATVSEVDVADVHHSTRVVPRREPLLANVQGPTQSDFQRAAGPAPSPVRELLKPRQTGEASPRYRSVCLPWFAGRENLTRVIGNLTVKFSSASDQMNGL